MADHPDDADQQAVQTRLFRPARGLSQRTRRLGLRRIRRIRQQLRRSAEAEAGES